MNLRILLVAVSAMFLTACASIDGTYLPSCNAYAGSEIRLANGRFHWSKFTDQVVIDDEGNRVDPFPGYPLEGAYEISGETLTLVPDGSDSPQVFYVHRDGKEIYLLNAEEKAVLQANGKRPKCALKRQMPGT